MKCILTPLMRFILRLIMTVGMLIAYPIITFIIVVWNFRWVKASEIEASMRGDKIIYFLQRDNEDWIKRYLHGEKWYKEITWTSEFHYIWGYPPNNINWPTIN